MKINSMTFSSENAPFGMWMSELSEACDFCAALGSGQARQGHEPVIAGTEALSPRPAGGR
jgi:hypothetical protein